MTNSVRQKLTRNRVTLLLGGLLIRGMSCKNHWSSKTSLETVFSPSHDFANSGDFSPAQGHELNLEWVLQQDFFFWENIEAARIFHKALQSYVSALAVKNNKDERVSVTLPLSWFRLTTFLKIKLEFRRNKRIAHISVSWTHLLPFYPPLFLLCSSSLFLLLTPPLHFFQTSFFLLFSPPLLTLLLPSSFPFSSLLLQKGKRNHRVLLLLLSKKEVELFSMVKSGIYQD